MQRHPAIHVYLYGPNLGPIETSFELAQSRLENLPRLHFEPDGSFGWALDSGEQQVFGMIYDARGAIQYCELRGRCDLTTWQRLCNAINSDPAFELEVLKLPDRQRQDLQSFELNEWPESNRKQIPN